MRGFINTLVFVVECHTGGAAGQSNSLLCNGGRVEMGRHALPTSDSHWEQLHLPRGELCIKGLEHWMDQV